MDEVGDLVKSIPFAVLPVLVKKEDNLPNLVRGFLAETFGMFVWIFLACGSVPAVEATLGSLSISPVSLLVIASTFGLGITISIYMMAEMSGAHFNPAVSLSLLFLKQISVVRFIIWVIAQFFGSAAAAACLRLFVTNAQDRVSALGLTKVSPAITWLQGYYIESMLTTILIVCVIGIAVKPFGQTVTPAEQHHTIGAQLNTAIIIGFVIMALNIVGIPVTGASMNPARSFGPALIAWDWYSQIVYYVGPLTGSIVGTLISLLLIVRPEGRIGNEYESI